jgi:urease accessory protein
MIQASKLIPQGKGLAAAMLKRASTIELDWDVRQKSRFAATDSAGRSIGVFLPRGSVLRGGDVLVAEDGSLVQVWAAPQQVLRITHCQNHGSPFDLLRAAYHLGNRHVPIELKPDFLQIEPDHVLADMLRAMHLIVNPVEAPFEPESGAYASDHAHGAHEHHGHEQHAVGAHGHGHGHTHAPALEHPIHEHGPAHGHTHEHGRDDPRHQHGPDCDHGHDHGHKH